MKYIIAIVAIVAATGILLLSQPKITAQLAGNYMQYYPEDKIFEVEDGAVAYSTRVFNRISEALIRTGEHNPTGESRFQKYMTELHKNYPNATNYAICYAMNDGKIVCGTYTRSDYEGFLNHTVDQRYFAVTGIKRAIPPKPPTEYKSIEAIKNASLIVKPEDSIF